MLTRKGAMAVLQRIMETGGMEAMEADVEILRNDFDEREGILKEYGEAYDEEADEYEWTAKAVQPTGEAPVEDWEGKYNALKAKYIDRFFGTPAQEEVESVDDTEIVEVTEEEEPEPPSIDDILYKEG